jgi:hypothetical protein
MIFPKTLTFLCSVTIVVAFRAPDNMQKGVILPEIRAPKVNDAVPQIVPRPRSSSTKLVDEPDILMHPRHATERRKWGQDNEHDTDYWYKYVKSACSIWDGPPWQYL